MDLAVNNERIDGAADVVDRGVVDELDGAGLWVDFDLADLAAVRETRLGDGLVAFSRERALQIGRQIGALGGGARHVEQTDRMVGALHGEASVLEFDVSGARL